MCSSLHAETADVRASVVTPAIAAGMKTHENHQTQAVLAEVGEVVLRGQERKNVRVRGKADILKVADRQINGNVGQHNSRRADKARKTGQTLPHHRLAELAAEDRAVSTPFPATKYPIAKPKPRKRRTRDVRRWALVFSRQVEDTGEEILIFTSKADAINRKSRDGGEIHRVTIHGVPVPK